MTKDELKQWLDAHAIDFNNEVITYLEVVAQMFNITAYDSEVERQLGMTILEALNSVATRTTFDYQAASPDNYLSYLIAVNLRDVGNLLNWGGSIRGAWFEAPKGGWNVSEHLSPADSDSVSEIVLHNQEEMNDFIIKLYELVKEQEAARGSQ